jgi:hypothetical protein
LSTTNGIGIIVASFLYKLTLGNIFKSGTKHGAGLTKLVELIPNCDDYDEDKYTKIYMDKYGIDNVRGGSYTSVKLDKETKNQLVKISNSTNNRCFNCGKDGHFAIKCPETKNIIQDNVKCFVCGKDGHFAKDCKYGIN